MVFFAIIFPIFLTIILIACLESHRRLLDRILQHEFMTDQRINELHNKFHDLSEIDAGSVVENQESITDLTSLPRSGAPSSNRGYNS
jgi:predicted PurR-regulated permease PerM